MRWRRPATCEPIHPGPAHYAGDVLTLEVLLDEFVEEEDEPVVTLSLDGGAPFEAAGRVEGRYADAQAVIDALEPTLQTGSFEHPLAADHFAIVTLLAADEQQVVSLTLAEDEATARVIQAWPDIEDVALQRVEGTWQITGD